MLGLLVFALACIALIARGYIRYNRYRRAEAAGAVPPAAGPGNGASDQPASSASQPVSGSAGQQADGGAGPRADAEPDQPPSAADRAGSAGMTAPGGQSGA